MMIRVDYGIEQKFFCCLICLRFSGDESLLMADVNKASFLPQLDLVNCLLLDIFPSPRLSPRIRSEKINHTGDISDQN